MPWNSSVDRTAAQRGPPWIRAANPVKSLTAGIRYRSDTNCGGSRRFLSGRPTSKPREHKLRIRPAVRPSPAGHWAPGPHPPARTAGLQLGSRRPLRLCPLSPLTRPPAGARRRRAQRVDRVAQQVPGPLHRRARPGSARLRLGRRGHRRGSSATASPRRPGSAPWAPSRHDRRAPRGHARSQALSTSLIRWCRPSRSAAKVPGRAVSSTVRLTSLAALQADLASATASTNAAGGTAPGAGSRVRSTSAPRPLGQRRAPPRARPARRRGPRTPGRPGRRARSRGRPRSCAAGRRTRRRCAGSRPRRRACRRRRAARRSARPTPAGSIRRRRTGAGRPNSKGRCASPPPFTRSAP